MNDDLITVIVPMYNAESYIEKCIRSLRKQKYRNIEIIVVDDGSQDNSAKICGGFCGKDKRIRLIRQNNQGVSAARNAGLEAAKGKFVVFADADDYVDEDYVSVLYELIRKNDADAAICSYYRKDGKKEKPEIVRYERHLTARSAIINMLTASDFDSSICCKMYRTDMAKRTGFQEEYCIAEDLFFHYQMLQQCRCISYNNHKCYHYVQHAESAVHAPLDRAKVRSLQVFEKMMEQCKDRQMRDAVAEKYVSTCFHLLSLERTGADRHDIRYLQQAVKKYRVQLIGSRMAGIKVKAACGLSFFSFRLVNVLLWIRKG